MITIEKYNLERKSEVDLLCVKPEQQTFTVGDIGDFISSLKSHEHPYLIISDGNVVGFFVLDFLYTETYGFGDAKALGIRALFVDHHFQGKGIATKALNLLPSYVVTHYPDFEVLQLTVNCRNTFAYSCYCKCGFEDTGNLYLGGPFGPQHIMQRNIRFD